MLIEDVYVLLIQRGESFSKRDLVTHRHVHWGYRHDRMKWQIIIVDMRKCLLFSPGYSPGLCIPSPQSSFHKIKTVLSGEGGEWRLPREGMGSDSRIEGSDFWVEVRWGVILLERRRRRNSCEEICLFGFKTTKQLHVWGTIRTRTKIFLPKSMF